MQKNLVIVESPAKAKTIEKFLGKGYKVMSSYGHIRDLEKKDYGIDLNHNFQPRYIVSEDKKNVVKELKKYSKEAESVWLASDEDREGEAIAWHLYEVLGLKKKDTKRIVFHEITKTAILQAIQNPRNIDFNLVDAQQARRVLDRLVGFELSPILWRKVRPSLSAGRVQSVAVRLIVEREREINAFVAEPAYRVVANFVLPDGTTLLKTELNKRLKTKEEAFALLEKCKGATFTIDDIVTKPVKKSPAAPFTTSTLQQEAAHKLGFTVAQTMLLAQKLYESGLITYMRTDSVNLSSLALNTAKEEIVGQYGEKYYKFRQYHTKTKGAQEAHEAIRPTYISNHTIKGNDEREKRLYELIWKRTIATQMADAELERTTVYVGMDGTKEKFVASGEVIKFDGFLQVYMETNEEDTENDQSNGILPPVNLHARLLLDSITATERFTQRPPRYTEASLVKRLEELGIGRPSTYAPTIQTIQQRAYVIKGEKPGIERVYNVLSYKDGKIKDEDKTEIAGSDRNKLIPTDIGSVVNDFLMEHFPDILDYNFTANVEKEFDAIAEGELEWTKAIDNFYKVFHPIVEQTSSTRLEHRVGERELGKDPESGKPVFVKIGRYGPIAQIGLTAEGENGEKPKFASLLKGQSIETITLEEALKLFDLPRTLGEFEEKIVSVGIGRFGPFVRHDNKFVSIPKEEDPMEISLERAVELIEEKRKRENMRLIKSFEEEEDMQLLNGRFGPYICYKKENYKLPKTLTDVAALTYEECLNIIETAASKKKKTAKSSKGDTKAKEEEKISDKKTDSKKAATKSSTAKTTTKKASVKKASVKTSSSKSTKKSDAPKSAATKKNKE